MERRSERLLAMGQIKRKAAAIEEPGKLSDRVDLQSQPRRRGLFQDEPPSDATITTPPHRLAAQSPLPAREAAPSPFILASRLTSPPRPRGINPDENTPPRKRRLLDDDASASVIMEDAPGAETTLPAATTGEPAATPQQAPRPVEPEEAATPSTWFTPVRPSRPPRPPSGHAPSGLPPLEAPHSAPPSMPSRMPSFAQWMMEEDDAAPAPVPAPPVAEPMPFASPQPARRPAPGAGSGVDMTDLALLYDPMMAAAAGRSPPTPIEKILQRQQAAAAEEDGTFEQDEFEPAYDN